MCRTSPLHLGCRNRSPRGPARMSRFFGIKVHIYADEMANYALSKLLPGRSSRRHRVESFNPTFTSGPSLSGTNRCQRDGTSRYQNR